MINYNYEQKNAGIVQLKFISFSSMKKINNTNHMIAPTTTSRGCARRILDGHNIVNKVVNESWKNNRKILL